MASTAGTPTPPQGRAPEVRAGVRGRAGLVILDRPGALNALTLPMIREITRVLVDFQGDPAAERLVLLSASSRAFCAGGDIRRIRDLCIEGSYEEAEAFFVEEFALNLMVSRLDKPYIALIDGLCMGGGIGLSVHGRFRVVTERAVLAMPEVTLGYFPDIGGTYFLPRLPGAVGTWLALTGARITGGDAVHARLATHFVPHSRIGDLTLALEQDDADVAAILERFSETPPQGPLVADRAEIDRIFAGHSLTAILERLEAADTDFAAEALAQIRAASPRSLELTLAALESGAGETLEECLERELQLSRGFIRHPDFIEGVRAVLVDKDRAPQWESAPGSVAGPGHRAEAGS